MKWISKLADLFRIEEMQGVKTEEVLIALEDPVVRKIWIHAVFGEIVRINREVDLRLQNGIDFRMTDLSVRRKALQFVLEEVLSAKRRAKSHNPLPVGQFDHEGATVQPV